MNNITTDDISNQFITFSEAKKRFIKELYKEIEKVHNELQIIFSAYANPNRNAYEQNIYLSFDFDNTIYKKNRLTKLFFVIESLNKLDLIVCIINSKDKSTNKKQAPKIIRYDFITKHKNFNLHFNITGNEIERINQKIKEFSKYHWSEELKIKYSMILKMGDIIINFDKNNKKDNSHKKFYDLLFTVLGNKEQTQKYTKVIFGKGVKNKTKKELLK